jgi:hypothetical protein
MPFVKSTARCNRNIHLHWVFELLYHSCPTRSLRERAPFSGGCTQYGGALPWNRQVHDSLAKNDNFGTISLSHGNGDWFVPRAIGICQRFRTDPNESTLNHRRRLYTSPSIQTLRDHLDRWTSMINFLIPDAITL